MQKTDKRLDFLIVVGIIVFVVVFFLGCRTKEKSAIDQNTDETTKHSVGNSKTSANNTSSSNQGKFSKGPSIEIKENSPADTVKVFYDRLRQKKIRDAILLTNLRPAVEGMTDSDLDEFVTDFSFLAASIPDEMPINGEIILDDEATVMVNMPNEEKEKIEVQKINLRKEKDNWIVLVADAEGEKRAKREGNKYFSSLRMDVHHAEAKAMLTRINKAQMVFRMKNDGRYANLRTLVEKGYVPQDALGSITTGYKYDIELQEDNYLYTALATPATYGKTGNLSFAYQVLRDKQPELIAKDMKGKSIKTK